MGAGIGGHHEIGRAEPAEDRLGREARVLEVVDEHVVEERLTVAGHRRGALQECREVHHVQVVEHRLVLAQEPGELVPSGESAAVGGLRDRLGRAHRLLRAEQELPHVVGEPAEPQERPVRGPLGPVLIGQQLLHLRELLGGREHLGGLRVPERLEAVLQDPVGEAVHRDDLQPGERRGQPPEQRRAARVLRPAGPRDEHHPLGVGAAGEQPREALPEDRGLAGARPTGDEQRPLGVREHGLLLRIGKEGDAGGTHAAMLLAAGDTPG